VGVGREVKGLAGGVRGVGERVAVGWVEGVGEKGVVGRVEGVGEEGRVLYMLPALQLAGETYELGKRLFKNIQLPH
jgi:hypothetical protein